MTRFWKTEYRADNRFELLATLGKDRIRDLGFCTRYKALSLATVWYLRRTRERYGCRVQAFVCR